MASKRAEPLTNRHVEIVLGMLPNTRRNLEVFRFLSGDLFGVAADNKINLMSGGIYLLQQTLEIDGATGAGGGDHEFHSLEHYNGIRAQTIQERKECDLPLEPKFEKSVALGH